MAHDPETRQLIRESLRLIVQSEKLLTQLEDHVNLLRTFVSKVDVGTTLRILNDDDDTDSDTDSNTDSTGSGDDTS